MRLTPDQFTWDDFFWKVRVTLPFWQGVRSAGGGNSRSGSLTAAHVDLVFAPEGRDDRPLEEAEVDLAQWLLDNESAVSAAVIGAIHHGYGALQTSYGYSAEERRRFMPDVRSADDLRGLVRLRSLNVHPLRVEGIPYVGFELACAWDVEHGLGVLTHGTRVVEVGGAETAILLWIAERDAKSRRGHSA